MWGALAPEQRAHKFADRAVEGRFVGLAANGSAWVLYSTNLPRNRHFTVVQATFDEADLMGGDDMRDGDGPTGEVEWPLVGGDEGRSEGDDEDGDGCDGAAGGGPPAEIPAGSDVAAHGGSARDADGPAAGDASQGAMAGDGGGAAGGDDGDDAGSGDEAPRSRMLDELRPDRGFVSQIPSNAATVGVRPDGGGFSLRPRLGAPPPARAALIAEAEEWADRACNAWSLMQGGGDESDDSADHGYAFVSCVDSKKYVADERGMRVVNHV
jgi:hypothetical protein